MVNFPTPIDRGLKPPEGSKVVTIPVVWAGDPSSGQSGNLQPPLPVTINLLSQFQSGQFTAPQTVYIDNNTCPYEVQLVCQETLQRIRIPPFSYGGYPMLAGPAPVFVATLISIGFGGFGAYLPFGTTTFHFLNIQDTPFEVRQPEYGQNFASWSTNLNMAANAAASLLTASQLHDPTRHFVLSGFELTLAPSPAFAQDTYVVVTIYETGQFNFPIHKELFLCPINALAVFSRVMSFRTPVIQRNPGTDILMQVSTVPISGSMFMFTNLTFGVVTIA